MAFTYEQLEQSLIDNTVMEKVFNNGVHLVYRITPIAGYVLHDKGRDFTEIDPITSEEVIRLGYTSTSTSCPANYDFEANPREFYAVLASDVPADQIFAVGGDNHETV